MVWGRTQAARRYAPAGDVAVPCQAPIPQSATCARCETSVILAGGKLPSGWVEIGGHAYCPDEPEALAGAVGEVGRPIQTNIRHVEIGPKGVRYTGCRVGAEVIHGMAQLEFRAGASAPPGRDNRVVFLLDRRAIRELIQHLCDIGKELPNG